jgi:hypothetical protein
VTLEYIANGDIASSVRASSRSSSSHRGGAAGSHSVGVATRRPRELPLVLVPPRRRRRHRHSVRVVPKSVSPEAAAGGASTA